MSKISAYSSLASPATNDVLLAVDVDDTSMAPTGTDKQLTIGGLGAQLALLSSLPWVTVSPIGLSSGAAVKNNGAQFGPDTAATTTCGIQEALNSLPACTVNQKSFGLAYTVAGKYGRLAFQPGVYQTSSLVTIPAGQIAIEGAGMSSWIPPNNIGLTQASGGTVIACTSYTTGGVTVPVDVNGNPATALFMRDLDIRMQSPGSAQNTSTPAVLNLNGWKSGEVSNVNVVEAPVTPGQSGSNLYKIIDCSPGGSKDTTELRNVRGWGGNIAVTLSGAHITAIGVTGGGTSTSIIAGATGLWIAQNLGCYFANLHGYSTTYGLTFISYFGHAYTPMVIYGCHFEAVTHYLNWSANATGTLVILNPCWNQPSLNPVTDIAATMAGGPAVLTRYEQDETSDTTPTVLHIAPAAYSTAVTQSVVHSGQTAASAGFLTITSATAGNLLVAIVGSGQTTAPPVYSNLGSAGSPDFTVYGTFAESSATQTSWLAYKVATGGETSINTGGTGATSCTYWEIAGMGAAPAIDAVVATNAGTSITTLTSGSLTTTSAQDVVLMGVGGVNSFGTVNAWTATNASVPVLVSAAGNTDGGSLIPGSVLTAATFTANWTTARTPNGMIVAAFKPTTAVSPFSFTAQPYDQIYVLTTAGGMTALTLDGHPLFNGSFSAGQQVYVGAGHSLAATFSGTTPVFEVIPQ